MCLYKLLLLDNLRISVSKRTYFLYKLTTLKKQNHMLTNKNQYLAPTCNFFFVDWFIVERGKIRASWPFHWKKEKQGWEHFKVNILRSKTCINKWNRGNHLDRNSFYKKMNLTEKGLHTMVPSLIQYFSYLINIYVYVNNCCCCTTLVPF